MTEKTNNKQKNKKIVLALVWNLLVRRLFGGVLGICDFRHKTLKQSQISLTPAMRDRLGPKDQVFQDLINDDYCYNCCNILEPIPTGTGFSANKRDRS